MYGAIMRWLRSNTKCFCGWSFCALVWLVATGTLLQVVVPRDVIAGTETNGEPSEEESDPVEPSEELPQLCEENSPPAGRPQLAVGRRLFSVPGSRCCRGIVWDLFVSELTGRNGMGGPLRC